MSRKLRRYINRLREIIRLLGYTIIAAAGPVLTTIYIFLEPKNSLNLHTMSVLFWSGQQHHAVAMHRPTPQPAQTGVGTNPRVSLCHLRRGITQEMSWPFHHISFLIEETYSNGHKHGS